jgi:hypothetical protein
MKSSASKGLELFVNMTYIGGEVDTSPGVTPMPRKQAKIERDTPSRVERLGFRLDEETRT